MYPLIEAAAPVLRRQHSLITRRQSIRLVNSEACVRHLLRTGVWESVDRGVYGPAGVPMTWRRRLMLATLLAPPRSLISHRACAALNDVGGMTEPTPEITIPRGTKLRRPWLITHESKDLHLASAVTIDAIATTDLPRLAMDLGGHVGFERFKHTIRELRLEHGVSSDDLLTSYLRHKRQGRTGGAALRDWLDRYYSVPGRSESGLELVVLDAIIDADLLAPIRQHWVVVDGHHYRIDLAYPGLRIAIEVDGAQHEEVDIARADERRQARLESAGWTVIRIRSSHFASDLLAALRRLRQLLSLV